MSVPPRILNVESLAKTQLFEIEAVDLEFHNGVNAKYERLKGSKYGAVLIVALNTSMELLLVREYAVGMERYELNFPKGRIENNEEVLSAANREIREEIGYAARRLELLSSVTLAPGYSNQQTHIVLATQLYADPCDGDEPEPLQVVTWPMEQAYALSQHKEFTDARNIAALYLVKEYMKGKA